MLIPIGLDRNEVRRNPWISYGIIAVNVLVFLGLWFALGRSDVPARATEKMQAVVQYLFAHPSLRIPADLDPLFGASAKNSLERARQESLRRGAPVEWVVR